jgi:hypothetical protein
MGLTQFVAIRSENPLDSGFWLILGSSLSTTDFLLIWGNSFRIAISAMSFTVVDVYFIVLMVLP